MVAGVRRSGACPVAQNEEPGRLNGICQVTRLPAPSVDPAFLASANHTTDREPTRGAVSFSLPQVAAFGGRRRQMRIP